jgi:hypothetical protein
MRMRCAFCRSWRYPGRVRNPLRCRLIKRDHRGRCISVRGAHRCRGCRSPPCCGIMRYRETTCVGFPMRMGGAIDRVDDVPRSTLWPCGADGCRRGHSHGVTAPSLTGSRSKPGSHRRITNDRPVGAHHIDRGGFDRIVRAGCKETTSRHNSGTKRPGPDSSAVPHSIPLWRRSDASS